MKAMADRTSVAVWISMESYIERTQGGDESGQADLDRLSEASMNSAAVLVLPANPFSSLELNMAGDLRDISRTCLYGVRMRTDIFPKVHTIAWDTRVNGRRPSIPPKQVASTIRALTTAARNLSRLHGRPCGLYVHGEEHDWSAARDSRLSGITVNESLTWEETLAGVPRFGWQPYEYRDHTLILDVTDYCQTDSDMPSQALSDRLRNLCDNMRNDDEVQDEAKIL